MKQMAKVLLPNEIKTKKVFCEFRFGIAPQYCSIKDVFRWLLNTKYKYGKTWRCWNEKPTEEQMMEVKWE